jgi:hypothetical protein
VIVHQQGGGSVALPQAGAFAYSDAGRASGLQAVVQAVEESVGSSKMARHVGAYAHGDFRLRRQIEMRIEIGNAVDLEKGDAIFFGKSLQLIGGEISIVTLDSSQVVENQETLLTPYRNRDRLN